MTDEPEPPVDETEPDDDSASSDAPSTDVDADTAVDGTVDATVDAAEQDDADIERVDIGPEPTVSPSPMISRRGGAFALPVNAPIVALTVIMTITFAMFLLIEPTPRWIALFGGVIAAPSVDGVLRASRRAPFADGHDTAPYLFLPAVFALAVPVFVEHNVRGLWATPAAIATGLVFGAVVMAEVASVREFDPARGIGRFITSAATYFVAFALFSLTYRFGLDLPTAMTAVALVSAMLAVGLLHEGEVDPIETLIFAVITALAVAEVRWALHFLPIDSYLAGFAMLLAFYFVTGLIHSHLVRHLTATLAVEYSVIAAAGVALVVWARNAGIA